MLDFKMKNFTYTAWLFVFILLGLFLTFEATENDLKGDHLCPRVEWVLVKKVIPRVISKKVPYYTKCPAFPPMCYKYKHESKTINKTVSVNITRTVFSCCPGYEEANGSCTPCVHGFWGPNCTKECNCFNDAACNFSTGECICLPGWTGPKCSETSPYGNYTLNCSDECKGNSTCNIKNGSPGNTSGCKGRAIDGSICANVLIFLPAIIVGFVLVSAICCYHEKKNLSDERCCSKNKECEVTAKSVTNSGDVFQNPVFVKTSCEVEIEECSGELYAAVNLPTSLEEDMKNTLAHSDFTRDALEPEVIAEAKKFYEAAGREPRNFKSKGFHLELDVLY